MKNYIKEKMNKSRILRLFFLIFLSLTMAMLCGACVFISSYLQKGNYVEDEESIEFASTEEEEFEKLLMS